jgi:hypothetical protein
MPSLVVLLLGFLVSFLWGFLLAEVRPLTIVVIETLLLCLPFQALKLALVTQRVSKLGLPF